jgi:Ran GTPase-activating protein (RanGAP) involved in mRNA processing and transport
MTKLSPSLLQRIQNNDSSLTNLELSQNSIDDEGVKALAVALKQNQTLTHLHLDFKKISDEGAKVLAVALEQNKTLIHLDLFRNNINVAGAKALADALKQNQTLTYFGLTFNNIGDRGAKALAVALDQNKTLTHLDLNSNYILHEGAKALATLLNYNKTLIHHLDLSKNKIGDEGAQALAIALVQNQTLTHLDLNSNYIGDEGAKVLAEALVQNQTLTHLDLNSNYIGDEGAKALAEALVQNQTLTHLDLNWNKIGDEGAKALAEALKQNQTLTHLRLNSNHIGDEGAKALAEALDQNQTLTHLDLDFKKISDEGAKALAEALVQNQTLTHLGLNENTISDNIRTIITERLARYQPTHTDFTSLQKAMEVLANEVKGEDNASSSTEHNTTPTPDTKAGETGRQEKIQKLEQLLANSMKQESQHILATAIKEQEKWKETLLTQLQANSNTLTIDEKTQAIDEKMQDAWISQKTHLENLQAQVNNINEYIAELQPYLSQMDTPLSQVFESDKAKDLWDARKTALKLNPNWLLCFQAIHTRCFHLLLALINLASGEFQRDKGIKGQLTSWLGNIHPGLALVTGLMDARESQQTQNNVKAVANQFLHSTRTIEQLAVHFAYQVTVSYRKQIAFLQDDQIPRFADMVHAWLFSGLKSVSQDAFLYQNTSNTPMDIEALAFRFRLLLLETNAPRSGNRTAPPSRKASGLLDFLNKFADIPTFTHAKLLTTDEKTNNSQHKKLSGKVMHPWTERVLQNGGFEWYPDPTEQAVNVMHFRSNTILDTKIEKYGYMTFAEALGCDPALFQSLCKHYDLVQDVPTLSNPVFKQLGLEIDRDTPLSRFIIHADTTTLGAQPEFHPPQQQQAPAASVATTNPSQSLGAQVTLLTQEVATLQEKQEVSAERLRQKIGQHENEIQALTVQAENAEERADALETKMKRLEAQVTEMAQLLLPQSSQAANTSVAPPAPAPQDNTSAPGASGFFSGAPGSP